MRHRKAGRKLGRNTKHRRALFRNLVQALIKEERIITTLPKAKEFRPLAERMITLGKKGDLNAKRRAQRTVLQPELLDKLFYELAPRFADRNGGYTRIIKLGRRRGDGAEMALVEFLPAEEPEEQQEQTTEESAEA